MSKDTIKKEIYKLIEDIEDEGLLNVLKEDIVAYTTSSSADILDELTSGQLKELDEAIEESKQEENLRDYDEFKKEFDEWRTNLKQTKGSKKI
jgi:hypothetical protein